MRSPLGRPFEPSFGVALLNDSKYGYSCRGNILSLSLLRSPKTPDPMADMGRHHFRYALFPHAFGPQLGEVIQEAALFNQPLALISTALPPQTKSFFAMDNPAVILDTVKLAEESDDIILRFYEAHGGHQTATLTTSLPFSKVVRVNLLEDGEEFVSNKKGEIPLSLRPFEILSLKLVSSGRCS